MKKGCPAHPKEKKMNYTYLLQCADGTYYCGWTNDLEKRLASHNAGKGGKYTRARLPVKLVYYEEFGEIEQAIAREKQIKGWTRAKKEALIDTINPRREDFAVSFGWKHY